MKHNDEPSCAGYAPPAPAVLLPHASDDTPAFDAERRFGGIARLYGSAGLARFRAAHVCVIGVGGVGSWAAEALARSAVGRITLIDMDHVAESNINRQLHALSSTLGMAKIAALAQRIAQINPDCAVTCVDEFVAADNIEQLIGNGAFDYVIDAIDDAPAKIALIAFCRSRRIPVITVGSAGGKTDPTRIAICDLSRTEQEPLLAKVRKRLRQQHGFPRGAKNKFGIEAVYSTEPLRLPEEDTCLLPDDEPAVPHTAASGREGFTGLNCAGFGSSVVVTASFGLVATGHVLRKLAASPQPGAAGPARQQTAG